MLQNAAAAADDDEPEMMADPGSASALGTAVLGQPQGAGGKPMDVLQYIKQQQMEKFLKRNADQSGEPKEHKFWDTQPVPKEGAKVSQV